jgi:NADH-quinone oxidoreductase subunit L
MALFPLAGFLILVTVGRRLGEPLAGWIGTVAVLASFVVAVVTAVQMYRVTPSARVFDHNYWTWFGAGRFAADVGIRVDQLSVTMCLFITGVSALIHLYSIGYMHGDKDFSKFFVYLNLFVFSMLVLVLANNLLVTFVGWEGVGVCSYWLVSFWFRRESAASAGKKAFLYNRVGDVGFLLAMFLIFQKVGSLRIAVIESHHGLTLLAGGTATAAVLLLFLAATGKSAQIPLFNWLPDAMEGPTPVSALIHAATMVTAGVYLLCRMNHLLAIAPDARLTIAWIGGLTALVAATIACAQQDIKKVLAFSTVSQIGYMIMAVGCQAYVAAIFLMVCHAFYKGVLFLGAGSVIHGLEDEQDLKRMGALRKVMLLTYLTFTAGWLAIAGVFPFSAFWSKGDVLDNVYDTHVVLWVIGVLTALFTAYYMTRLWTLAFTGEARWDKPGKDGAPAHHSPHDPGWVMLLPLFVLGALALVAGMLDMPFLFHDSLNNWLGPVFHGSLLADTDTSSTKITLGVIDAVVALLGLTVAYLVWRTPPVDKPALEPAAALHVWYWDEVYDRLIGRPGQALARFSATVIDTKVIDGAVNGVAALVRSTGRGTRRIQTGYVRNYALGIVLGLACFAAFLLSRVWWS